MRTMGPGETRPAHQVAAKIGAVFAFAARNNAQSGVGAMVGRSLAAPARPCQWEPVSEHSNPSPPTPPPKGERGAAPRISFVLLCCPEALVDSERILTQLRAEGYELSRSQARADAVIVNTCGFVDSAVIGGSEARTPRALWRGRRDRQRDSRVLRNPNRLRNSAETPARVARGERASRRSNPP